MRMRVALATSSWWPKAAAEGSWPSPPVVTGAGAARGLGCKAGGNERTQLRVTKGQARQRDWAGGGRRRKDRVEGDKGAGAAGGLDCGGGGYDKAGNEGVALQCSSLWKDMGLVVSGYV